MNDSDRGPLRTVQAWIYLHSVTYPLRSLQQPHSYLTSIVTSSSAIAERSSCRDGQLWIKVEDWNWGTIFTDIIGLYSTTVTYLASEAIEFGEKRKIRAIMPFKVIQGHGGRTNPKLVCDFLLVINSNWQHISYRWGVIAAYWSNLGHFAFLSHPWGEVGTTYDVHLGLVGKRVVDFLLVIIELFR